MWVDTVLAAIKELDYPTVFSLHPAEKSRPTGAVISDLPMRHLLMRATVLISRFSTVPFEAMARGVPFVYHNPHNEAVPTFKQPQGAFEVTATADELAAAASFVMGQAAEACPVVLLRGAELKSSHDGSRSLLRDKAQDMFR